VLVAGCKPVLLLLLGSLLLAMAAAVVGDAA
jgi:hypothetical protein